MCPFSACSQFKEISFAYEVLSDAEKRQVYDRHGEERLKEGGGGGPGFGSAEDLFSSIFGGGFFGAYSLCSASSATLMLPSPKSLFA